jgi:hypothetical protein
MISDLSDHIDSVQEAHDSLSCKHYFSMRWDFRVLIVVGTGPLQFGSGSNVVNPDDYAQSSLTGVGTAFRIISRLWFR